MTQTNSFQIPEQYYTTLFEALPGNSVLVLNNAPTFTILAATPAYLKQTGYTKEDMIGKGVFEAFPSNNTDPNYTGGKELLASYLHVSAHGEPHFLPVQRYDLQNEDGSFTEKYWRISNQPVLSPGGEVAYIIHTAEDITAQVHAEKREEMHQELQEVFRKVEESEQRFRALVMATSNVVYRMNPDWSEMRGLQGRGFLSDTGEAIGDWVGKYIPPNEQQGVNDAIQKAIKTKSIFELEHQVVHQDGTLGWTFSRAIPILDENGNIIEWFGSATDITQRKRTEEMLRSTKEEAERQKRLYETITSNTPDLIYVFDLDYRFTYANEALLAMWGKSPEEAIGKGLRENGYEEWHALMHEREIDHVAATKESIRGEVSFPHATLGRRVYDYILVPVVNEKGEVEAVAGTTRDITDSKTVQEALRRSEQQQAFLLRLNDCLKVLTDPAAIQYEAASLVARHVGAARVGYAEDGGDGTTVVVTMDYTNGVPSVKGTYNYDHYGPGLVKALRLGHTVVRSDIRGDASLSSEEKAAHASLQLGATINVPLLRSGELIAIFFMHFAEAHHWTPEEVSLMEEVAGRTWDAVVRARTELALRESEERFRLMANAVPQSMWITDAEGRTEFLNKHWCDYCGEPYSPTTAGDIALKYIHPEDAPKVMEAFGKAMQTGTSFEVEQRNLSKDGEYRWFLNRANPYRDPVTGRIVRWIGTGIDINDRKLAEQALRQSEEALEKKVQERTIELERANQELRRSNQNLEEFAYAASHDLKEPVRKIHFFADRLKVRLDSKLEEEDLRYFERLETAAKRMGSLIEDLLLYSHISRGTNKREAVDLNEILSLVMEDLELRIKEKGARIEVQPLPVVRGHQRQLQQLFENLLGNALKYNKPDTVPQVTIRASLIRGKDSALRLEGALGDKQHHLLEVLDNGIGFNQADAERIFNVFTRLHGNTEYKGTGVGLSIVRKVVENHDGYVWAEGSPGEGAAFKVLLPVS